MTFQDPNESASEARKKLGSTIRVLRKRLLHDLRDAGEAAAEIALTLLCRLVVIRHMEARGMLSPPAVTGKLGSKSKDTPERDAMRLAIVFAMLSVDMPGLFGDANVIGSVPAATIREVLDRFEDPALERMWRDDTALGRTFQCWNDPDREAIDARILDGRKIQSHEIASKTQLFTERYMVEWLLHNSLGLTWLCMCKKNGWTPDADAVLPVLEARCAEWRAKRDAGEVTLEALMPMESELEDQWKYFVLQPIPDNMIEKAKTSIRDVKILDPACGTGNFLLSAFDSLVAMYREEARHRGETWTDREIAESILENNLHGVDIDARVIKLAAVGLWLKAKALALDAQPKRMNLAVPAMGHLASLPADDPALVTLQSELRTDLGIPEEATRRLVTELAQADRWGTLLKLEPMVDETLEARARKSGARQGDLFGSVAAVPVSEARERVFQRLETFLARHT